MVNKSQLSTCVCYVDNNGEVQERFSKFTDVSSDKTAGALFQLVDKDINKYGLSNKIILVGQSYDGASVMLEGYKPQLKKNILRHCLSTAAVTL